MNILTAYYYVCADILKSELPVIPQLKLTNAKKYYGKISLREDYFQISLSKWNLDCGRIEWWDKEDIEDLIDTICHEFAHIFFWEHGEDHAALTVVFKNVVTSELKIRYLDRELNFLKEVV